jgi:GNAT superfamily N-acetyltransferase
MLMTIKSMQEATMAVRLVTTKRGLAEAAIRDLKEIDISNELGLSYDVTASDNGAIQLNRLDVESEFRWKGAASRFMNRLTDVADKKSVAIELEVGSGTDDENIIDDLPRFYSKWGFAWADGYMRREPVGPEITGSR